MLTIIDRRGVVAALAILSATPLRAAPTRVDEDDPAIAAIERRHGGRLGVFALDTGSGRTVGHRATGRFLMCSSFKGVLAACVLARIDVGLDRLDARVHYGAHDLLPYSPVTQAHVAEGVLSVEALCDAILTQSDNAAANLLLARFDRTEPTLNDASGLLDTTTPAAIVAILRALYLGPVLQPASLAVLERGMIGNQRGPARLRGSLPRDWTVGDRTGTSDAMCNDYAFARRPGRSPIAMAAYFEAPGKTMEAREALLRKVGTVIAGWAA